jgi:hypothetical protein
MVKNLEKQKNALTNIKSYNHKPVDPAKLYANQGYIMEEQDAKKWRNSRLKRLEGATSYTMDSLIDVYIPPNPYVLNQKLVQDNFLQQTIKNQQIKNDYIISHTYYNPNLLNPPVRDNLYSGNRFSIKLI